MSLNTLLRSYYTNKMKLAFLWAYYDSWVGTASPIVRRNALRVQCMALIYEDRNHDL